MAQDTIEIRRPMAGAQINLGRQVEFVVDLTLARPWFEAPSFGQHIRTITGQSRRGLDFQLTSARPVLSVTQGRAAAFDTRKDCYTRTDTIGAGLGCYVVVTSGDLKLTYANLKRGSARSGTVKVGDRLGYTGNTGHCLEGDRRFFVHFEISQGSTPREANAFEQPLEMLALVDGSPVTKPVAVPEGVVEIEGLELGEWTANPREYRIGPHELSVMLRQGSHVRASAKRNVDLTR